MAGTGVGKFSSTAGSNTANMTVNFAENMAPSNVNNAARELMGHMRDMYEQLGDGYFEFGDGDGTYTVARGDADTITITSASDISSVYFAGRKIRITDGGANVVEGTIASSSHSSTTQTVNLTGISLASGTPTKVELGIDTAAFGGRVILDDDGDTYIEAPTDDTIDIYVAGAKDFVITANTFTAESGSTIAAQALTATTGAFTDNVTITTDDNTYTLTLKSTDADANQGPLLSLHRDSGSPADDDAIGGIQFRFEDDAGNVTTGHNRFASIVDASNGSEDCRLVEQLMIGGSAVETVRYTSAGTIFNEQSADLDFRVESNGNTHMIFVDGGSDHVNIGGSSDLGGVLNVSGSTVIQTADNENTLTLISTDADASVGPNLRLYRNSSSPADSDDIGAIRFDMRNDNSQDFTAAQITGDCGDISDGTEDAEIHFDIMTAGTLREYMRLSSGNIIFNEDSQDIDFRVESNGNANMLVVDAGNDRIGVGTNVPDASLHVLSASAGSVSAASTEGLVVENSGNSSIHILAPDASDSRILFGSPSDNVNGFIKSNYDGNYLHMATGHGSGVIKIGSGSNGEHFRIIAGAASMGNEAAPDAGEGGMTFNQGSGDGNILTLKSSDVAHGITDYDETDTYATFKKTSATRGGLKMTSFAETGQANVITLRCFSTDVDNTESNNAEGSVQTFSTKKNGTSDVALGDDDNLFACKNSSNTQFIVKGDGELFSNTTGTVGTFDSYEDAQLVRAYDLSHMKGVINSKFDKFVQYNKDDLQKAKLIGTDADGNATPFVNITGMSRLHNGAIWQQYEATQRLTNAMYELAKAAVGEDKANEILEQNEIKLLN